MNILASLPDATSAEVTDVIVKGQATRVERIVSQGQRSDEGFWYDQEEAEWVMVLTGRARLQFEDRLVELGPGDAMNIAAHERHRVDWTDPQQKTVWLAVFYVELTLS